MKKTLAVLMLVTLSIRSFAQKPTADKPDYLQRSKNQQKAATILLISGPVLIVAPLLINSGIKKGGNATEAIVYGTIAAGFLTFPASITLFIIASGNQKKAVKLGFRNEKIPLLTSQAFTYHSVPSLTLKISL